MLSAYLMISMKFTAASLCCCLYIPCLVVIAINSSTHANCKALLVVSALSQQIMLICQVAMFAYDLYIENLMPQTEMDEYWFCIVHECCYFITTYVAIMIVIERLIATAKAESYETLPINKVSLTVLIFIGALLSLPFSYVIHELDQYFPPIVLMSVVETVVIVLSLKLYHLTTQRLANLPYDFKRVSAKYQLGEVLLFTRAVLVPILISSVLKSIGLVPPLLWKLGYITYAYAGTAFFMTHAINCVVMKATMIFLHKGMRRTLFKTMGITSNNQVCVVQPAVPKLDETSKYFEMLKEAWA